MLHRGAAGEFTPLLKNSVKKCAAGLVYSFYTRVVSTKKCKIHPTYNYIPIVMTILFSSVNGIRL